MLSIEIQGEELQIVNEAFNTNFIVAKIESPEQVSAAYTSTIRVAKTQKNSRLLGLADVLNSLSDLPYTSISAVVRYFGQVIDFDTKLVLNSIDEFYNFNLFFKTSALATILSEKTLQDLDLGTELYSRATQNYSDTSLDYINAYYYSFEKGYNNAWYSRNRAYKLKKILSKIVEQAGYTFSPFPTQIENFLNDKYLLPTNEKHSYEQNFQDWKSQYEGRATRTTDYVIPLSQATGSIIVDFEQIDTTKGFYGTYLQMRPENLVYQIKVHIETGVIGATLNQIGGFAIGYFDASNNFVDLHKPIDFPDNQLIKSTFVISVASELAGLITNNRIYVRIVYFKFDNDGQAILKAGSYIETLIADYIPENLVNVSYGKDLPPIKQKDFLRNILYMSGCVLEVNNQTKQIEVIAINHTLENTYIDWTEKIDFGAGYKVVYNPEAFGQTTNIKFKNTNEGAYSFTISNQNIAEKKEIGLQFYRCNSQNGIAITPIRKRTFPIPYQKPSEIVEDLEIRDINSNMPFGTIEYKKQDATIVKVSNYPNLLGLGVGAYNVNTAEQTYEGEQCTRPYISFLVPAGSNKVFVPYNDLFELSTNLSYVDKLYNKFKKVTFEAKLSIVDIINLSPKHPIFIGANIQRKFFLISVQGWRSPNENCTIEMYMITD